MKWQIFIAATGLVTSSWHSLKNLQNYRIHNKSQYSYNLNALKQIYAYAYIYIWIEVSTCQINLTNCLRQLTLRLNLVNNYHTTDTQIATRNKCRYFVYSWKTWLITYEIFECESSDWTDKLALVTHNRTWLMSPSRQPFAYLVIKKQ